MNSITIKTLSGGKTKHTNDLFVQRSKASLNQRDGAWKKIDFKLM